MTPTELDKFLKHEGSIGERILRRQAKAKAGLSDLEARVPPAIKARARPFYESARAAIDAPGLPRTSRPVNADGGATFHFAVTRVTKGSPVLNKAGLTKSGLAIAHQAYVERPHASEKLHTPEGLSTNIEMTALENDGFHRCARARLPRAIAGRQKPHP